MSFDYIDEATGAVRPALAEEVPPGLWLFGNGTEAFAFDGYWIVYETAEPISKEARKQLKEIKWRLQRHSRTNKEMWIYHQ